MVGMRKLLLLLRWVLPWFLSLSTVYGFIYLLGHSSQRVNSPEHIYQQLGTDVNLNTANSISNKCNPCLFNSKDQLVKDVDLVYFEQHVIFADKSAAKNDPFYDCIKNENIPKIHKIINHLPVEDPFTPYLYRCSIESEMLDYPDRCIVIWHNETIQPEQLVKNPSSNLKFIPLDVGTILSDTPIVFWYKTFRNSSHIYDSWDVSDGLRLAILYKYGGRYTDSDFISISAVTDVKMNMAYENFEKTRIANGYMEFPSRHPFVLLAMWRFVFDYSSKRAMQGPILITNTYNWWMNRTIGTLGGEIKVKDRTALYPASWKETKDLYNGNQSQYIWKKIHKANMIHVWSHIRTDRGLTPANGSIIYQLMQKNCPTSHLEYVASAAILESEKTSKSTSILPIGTKKVRNEPKLVGKRPNGARPKSPRLAHEVPTVNPH